MVTREVVGQACAEWLRLGLAPDAIGVAEMVCDEHALEEGLVSDEGEADWMAIELAVSEWAGWAVDAFIALGVDEREVRR